MAGTADTVRGKRQPCGDRQGGRCGVVALSRANAVLLSGDVALARVASAGDAWNGGWAVSGAAGLYLPAPGSPVPAVTILWCEDARTVTHLLAEADLRQTHRRDRAVLAVVASEPELFAGSIAEGIVRYQAPIQIIIDCLALGRTVAADAMDEAMSWWAASPTGRLDQASSRARSKRRGLGAPAAPKAPAPARGPWTAEERWRFEDTGVTWESIEVDRIGPSSVERSRHRFRAHLPELIWNTAALEGNAFTLPEVKTLLEGVTVGRKKLEDAEQFIALSEAYSRLDEMVGAGRFSLSKEVSDNCAAWSPGTRRSTRARFGVRARSRAAERSGSPAAAWSPGPSTAKAEPCSVSISPTWSAT